MGPPRVKPKVRLADRKEERVPVSLSLVEGLLAARPGAIGAGRDGNDMGVPQMIHDIMEADSLKKQTSAIQKNKDNMKVTISICQSGSDHS